VAYATAVAVLGILNIIEVAITLQSATSQHLLAVV